MDPRVKPRVKPWVKPAGDGVVFNGANPAPAAL
jgi:hypothetical protein